MSSKADIKRQSGSPFRPPRYTEPTNVRETRKMRQSKFRRKYQEVRAINKSLYAQPGLETDDYDWNNYKYSNKPQHIPQTKTDNTTKFPESFVSLHGFQPGKELEAIHHKDRPKSADSVASLSSLTSLKKYNQFDDTTSKYEIDLRLHLVLSSLMIEQVVLQSTLMMIKNAHYNGHHILKEAQCHTHYYQWTKAYLSLICTRHRKGLKIRNYLH